MRWCQSARFRNFLLFSSLSGITSLFRSAIGPIREKEEGLRSIEKVLQETAAIMKRIHAPLPDNIEEMQLEKLKGMGHQMKSSLQRDMEKNLSIEADHLYGYLLNIDNQKNLDAPF
jgi:2-dehydropantoate 2-reductase